jgi:hypothetical protein
MPVKKSIRPRKSIRISTLKSLTTGMDTAVVLPLVSAVVVVTMIGALTLSRQDEFPVAATAEPDSAIVNGSGVPPVEVAHDVEPEAQIHVAQPAPVTITGCLERDDERFRLKDTSGADAPRSRSWKSAFLKKGSAAVEVVDASRRLKLTNHVGQRVSVTGTLSDGEMQVRSLRRIAASCKDTSARVTA